MNLDGLQEILAVLDIQNLTRLTLVDASELAAGHVPSFAPDAPALVLGLDGIALDSMARAVLAVYPKDFKLTLIGLDGKPAEFTMQALTGKRGRAVYIPELGAGTSFEAFQELIAHLRAPEDGCPWDKEQTHLSLRKHLLEESYETLSAMDEENPEKMCEEFGDLLLQVVLNAQIANEAGEFGMSRILHGIHSKIVRRHPHVFGEVKVDGVNDVLSNWQVIKAGERVKHSEVEKGVLDGLPAALPALTQAQEFQNRAAVVGFDWPEISGVLDKIKEEIDEVLAAKNQVDLTEEIGDLFFALVNLARWKKIDSESALRAASQKFKKRFKYVESRVRASGHFLQAMSMVELDELWNEAKRATH